MRTNRGRWMGAAMAGAALLLLTGTMARAQEASQQAEPAINPILKHVSIEAENGNLVSILKLMMKQVGADYTIDNRLYGVTVTAKLTDVPMRAALDTLTHHARPIPAGYRFTYEVENGIYSFVLLGDADVEAIVIPGVEVPPAEPKAPKVTKINVNFWDPGALARLFGGQELRTLSSFFGIINASAFNGSLNVGGQGSGTNGGGSGLGGNPNAGGGGTARISGPGGGLRP